MVVRRDESLVTPERRGFARALWWFGWLLLAIALAGIVPLYHDFNTLRSWMRLDWNDWMTHMWLENGIRLIVIGCNGVLFIIAAKVTECRRRGAWWWPWCLLGTLLLMVVSTDSCCPNF